ncbi:MAG TPA: PIG-L family deacetylase [Candidatus Angelobacter sp.]|nr:PIG-L family deacetylase [Candidatus Angelobacter sp.]
MRPLRALGAAVLLIATALAQTSTPSPTPPLLQPDERLKVDLLLVVAHPDDETGAVPYLLQLIDQHKRVAVVYTTHGEAGHNNMGPERARSLGAVREMELRHALESVGINNIWFMSGKDTPTQNVLESLANWGNGQVLEEMVRMVRLTRPEVILTWQPGFFVGENHGDHQAAGVLATEAFDTAGDPTVFPAQLAGPVKVNETLFDGLQPWQPKKLYYFPDSADSEIFKNTGPSYPTNGISPKFKKPYWRLAMETFEYHLTQYRTFIERMKKMDEKQIAEQEKNWGGSIDFVLGKSHVPGSVTGDVFEGITPGRMTFAPASREPETQTAALSVQLSGPWGFYESFRRAHGLTKLPQAPVPEVSIKRGATLLIPLELRNHTDAAKPISISLKLPDGWTNQSGAGHLTLEPESDFYWQVTVDAPKAEVKDRQEIECRIEADGKTLNTIKLSVRLANGGLPQN